MARVAARVAAVRLSGFICTRYGTRYYYSFIPSSEIVSCGNFSDSSGSAHDRDADGRLTEGAGWPVPAVAVQSPA